MKQLLMRDVVRLNGITFNELRTIIIFFRFFINRLQIKHLLSFIYSLFFDTDKTLDSFINRQNILNSFNLLNLDEPFLSIFTDISTNNYISDTYIYTFSLFHFSLFKYMREHLILIEGE